MLQLFSLCNDLNKENETMNTYHSFCYNYVHNKKLYGPKQYSNRYSHPGFAWAMTGKCYEKIGGLYEVSILGSGDFNIALALLNKNPLHCKMTKEYKERLNKFISNVKNLRIGYCPTTIRHLFHGSKINRGYVDRHLILVKHKHNPYNHLIKNKDGLLFFSKNTPNEFKQDIKSYFESRKE